MKRLFYDLETTGLNPEKNGVHQLAGYVEIDGEILEEFNIKIKPANGVVIDERALAVSNTTQTDLDSYTPEKDAYREFLRILEKYVSKYDKKDKFHLVGYNNVRFDNEFLRALFSRQNDKYFGSWFWSDSLDVMVLASNFLQARRREMPNFKLMTVARFIGLEVDDDKLHDGLYDVQLTRGIFNYVQKENHKPSDLQ